MAHPATIFAAAPPENYPEQGVPDLPSPVRPCVRGKFIYVGPEKFYVRGISYGPFAPEPNGSEYHTPQFVRHDFELMRAAGINAVRTYTVPPTWLLDLAAEFGLRVMVGLPWEQHVAFLDDPRIARRIIERTGQSVRNCERHPAILCYTIGNEIPAPIARWHGGKHVADFLRQLYLTCKSEDSDGLVTYANYPSTEYLDLPFLDFVSFNVYLESQSRLQAYLARLQNIANDRPLVIAELGLDAMRHGEQRQSHSIDSQLRTIFSAGCAGAFIFSWTDEWFRGGSAVEGWAFGLTDAGRRPKPALVAMESALREIPFPPQVEWPKVSVVVCTYNGARTLKQCLQGVQQLDYPNYETIVVDDGSTDTSAQIANQFPFSLIRTSNGGLSYARNIGMHVAKGQIIAYLDDDAWPDPQWLKYLVWTFLRTPHAAVGGPNIAPPEDGFSASCVAHAPGGPNHVLLTDSEAEHIPGCNMAFRTALLETVGGFDEQFRIAGDDVDVCWRLHDAGLSIGFSPSAMVFHHRRNSFRGYWRQQLNYGRAEAMLERKWPHKYNALGNPIWSGRLYGRGVLQALGWKGSRIYHGTWGSALFQSVYHVSPNLWYALPTTPEWYLILLLLAEVTALGIGWHPLLLVAPLLVIGAVITLTQSAFAARNAYRTSPQRNRRELRKLFICTTWLHLIQPAARLAGRISTGLTPWRRRGAGGWRIPWKLSRSQWSETWQPLHQRLHALESSLRASDAVVVRGGDFDDWDLEIRGGVMGAARLRLAVEDHAGGKQMVRLRAWPKCARRGALLAMLLIVICDAAAFAGAWHTWLISGVIGVALLLCVLRECGNAIAGVAYVTKSWKD